jgi:hypothetical protein
VSLAYTFHDFTVPSIDKKSPPGKPIDFFLFDQGSSLKRLPFESNINLLLTRPVQSGGGGQGPPLTKVLFDIAILVKRGFGHRFNRSSSVRPDSLTDTASEVGGEFTAVLQMGLGSKSFVP